MGNESEATAGADPVTNRDAMAALLRQLRELRDRMVAAADQAGACLDQVSPAYRASAENLVHYLSLRRQDIRPLQRRLAELGLSSLGRAESCVLASVDAVGHALARLLGEPIPESHGIGTALPDVQSGQRWLAEHTEALLGAAPEERSVRIMVTMPSEAATDPSLVRALLAAGMNVMRINCAHDDPGAWLAMIRNLRTAEAELKQSCRVFMDLGGPKLRTGPVAAGPAVIHIRPERDPYGRPVAPARIWLTAQDNPRPAPSPEGVTLPVPGDWLESLAPRDVITMLDARGANRKWSVVAKNTEGCWAETFKACYVVPGTPLRLSRKKGRRSQCTVGAFAPHPGVILLRQGDCIRVTADPKPGQPVKTPPQGRRREPATIACTEPKVVGQVRAGETIWFDDGKIGGTIEAVEPGAFLVRITHARPGGAKLRGGKGINLPDTDLVLPSPTPEDLAQLPFIAEHADAVEMSFVNSVADVRRMEAHLRALSVEKPAIVLKIETRRGFENLPAMLLEAMRWPCCGVMIARGDLAVECGFERLAEVQEEILWICEAAHVPVIWATQVLENLAQKGLPSRAEITDAAMGHRAECVMLNKGPHVLEAVSTLDNILTRMQSHQTKKRAMLRELRLAHVGAVPERTG